MNDNVKYEADLDFNKILNGALRVLFKDAVKVALTSPLQSVFFLKTLRWQKKAEKQDYAGKVKDYTFRQF